MGHLIVFSQFFRSAVGRIKKLDKMIFAIFGHFEGEKLEMDDLVVSRGGDVPRAFGSRRDAAWVACRADHRGRRKALRVVGVVVGDHGGFATARGLEFVDFGEFGGEAGTLDFVVCHKL